MPVASGQYWNGIHGSNASDAVQDEEGMQQMRTLARNMSFLMKSIALGKERYGLGDVESLFEQMLYVIEHPQFVEEQKQKMQAYLAEIEWDNVVKRLMQTI